MANLKKSELEEYVDAFVDDEIMDEKAERTYTKYKRVCQRFIDFFSEEEITKRDLIAYKRMLLDKYSIKTINNYLIIVNKFIKYVELSVQEPGFKREKIRKYISSNTLKLEKEQEKRSVDNVLETHGKEEEHDAYLLCHEDNSIHWNSNRRAEVLYDRELK